jgi:hypothetical protein
MAVNVYSGSKNSYNSMDIDLILYVSYSEKNNILIYSDNANSWYSTIGIISHINYRDNWTSYKRVSSKLIVTTKISKVFLLIYIRYSI